MLTNENREMLFGRSNRHKRDFYPTPQSIINTILFHVKLRKNARVWEPCAGDGRFSESLEKAGYNVVSHDLAEGHDFFDWKEAQAPIIVTNPPFKHIRKFIDHAFQIGVEQMVLVTPERLWACQKGHDQFKRHQPSRFANLTWREDYLQKGGSPDRSLAVTVWDTPHSEMTTYEIWQKAEKEVIWEPEQPSPVPHYEELISCDFCGALTRGLVLETIVRCDACNAVIA
jgi:hypothetical protein